MKCKIENLLPIIAFFSLIFVSCDEDETTTTLYSNVAVSAFTIADNDTVMSNLSYIFFSIDLIGGQIYNADSLPKGTDVSGLIANISFPGKLSQALIYTEDYDDPTKNDTLDYVTEPTKKIDFTADKVTLFIMATDDITTKSYDVKVNVHQEEPNILSWSELSLADNAFPVNTIDDMKVVYFKNTIFALLNADGSNHLYTAASPSQGIEQGWNKLSLTIEPNIESFLAGDEYLYLLDKEGALHLSTDGVTWTKTESQFYSTIGIYPASTTQGEYLLGISADTLLTSYPESDSTALPTLFPISGFSTPVIYKPQEYSTNDQLTFFGGKLSTGKVTNAVWSYDGDRWSASPINNVPQESCLVPSRDGASLFSYQTIYKDSIFGAHEAIDTWILLGGHSGGNYLRDIYYSVNNGVDWLEAGDDLELPDDIGGRAFASALVLTEPISTQRTQSTAWRMLETPVALPELTQLRNEEQQTAPYVYMFGGKRIVSGNVDVYNQVWRGIINRLTFTPIP